MGNIHTTGPNQALIVSGEFDNLDSSTELIQLDQTSQRKKSIKMPKNHSLFFRFRSTETL